MTADDAASLIASFGADNVDAVRLARFVSFAALVDATLLRTARLEFLPHTDASAEADLWFSPLVQNRSPKGFVIHSEVAELLRRGLSEQEAAGAFRVLERCHGTSAAALRIEEELNYLTLRSAPEDRTRINMLLEASLAALMQDASGGLESWAARMLTRLPASLRGLEQVEMLGIASELKLRREGSLEHRLSRREALPKWLGPFFLDRSLVEVGIELTELGLVFQQGPSTREKIDAPLTNPIVLELRWRDGPTERSKLVFVPSNRPSPAERVPLDDVRIVTLKGDVWNLEPASSAAESVHQASALRATPTAYANLLVWTAGPEKECSGYRIERRSRDGTVSLLPDPGGVPIKSNFWFDGEAPSDEVSYRVLPVRDGAATRSVGLGTLVRIPEVMPQYCSNWSAWIKRGPDSAQLATMYFNRGNRSRDELLRLARNKKTVALTRHADFLGGDLLEKLYALVREVEATGGKIFGALFDLGFPPLIERFRALRERAHLILSGSPARVRERKRLANDLASHGVEVVLRDLPASGMAHNKFLVVTNASGQATQVWTGNTTLNETGLLRQLSGALLLKQPRIASAFLDYWQQLATDAGETTERRRAPSHADRVISLDEGVAGVRATLAFSPVDRFRDVESAFAAVRAARQGIIFSLPWPDKHLVGAIRGVSGQGLYVAGVASRRTPGDLELFRGKERADLSRKALLEATSSLRRPHSLRAIVIDPFSEDATLITGSHSLSRVASRSNDENLVILSKVPQLAQHVAASIEQWLTLLEFLAAAKSGRQQAPRSDTAGLEPSVARARVNFWLGRISTPRPPVESPVAVTGEREPVAKRNHPIETQGKKTKAPPALKTAKVPSKSAGTRKAAVSVPRTSVAKKHVKRRAKKA